MVNKGNISTKRTIELIAAITLALVSFFSFVESSEARPQEAPKTEVVRSSWKQTRPIVHFHADIPLDKKRNESQYFSHYEVSNLISFYNHLTLVLIDHRKRIVQNFESVEVTSIHTAFPFQFNDEEGPSLA